MTDYFSGVDLGGTHLRIVTSDRDGNFLAKKVEKTRKETAERISDQIVEIILKQSEEIGVDADDLRGIGIASTGPMNLKDGELVKPTNLPFERVPLREPISKSLGTPVELVNDSTAGAMGERRFGAGRGLDSIVYVTLSTGIGGGAIVDGRPLLGKDGNAAEIGHIVVDPDGRLICGCGKKGHWEAYCSGRNMPNFVRTKLEEMEGGIVEDSLLLKSIDGDLSKLSSKILFESAKSGDSLSLELVQEIGKLNAIGFADLTNVYDPSLITVGGRVALENEELVLDPIRKHLSEYTRNREPEIMVTPLGEDVGLYGAIARILEVVEGKRNEHLRDQSRLNGK